MVECMTASPERVVTVVGSGSIGVAFALLFARSGWRVRCWDVAGDALVRAEEDLRGRLRLLRQHTLLPEPEETVIARVSFHEDLAEAVVGSDLVQECAPENLGVKRELLARLASITSENVVLASSSSAIVPSAMIPAVGGDRMLVAHPGNPPYLLPVIELVPSPQTRPDVVDRLSHFYEEVGLRPVRVSREVEGFVFNRLQGAVLREAYCLVRDGVASVDDIDTVVRLGLGRRWAVMGPFETVDLNTRGGIEAHAARMGPSYARMGAERGQDDPWTPGLVAEVARQRRELLLLSDWDERVAWRDKQLMRFAATEQVSAN